MSDEQDLNWDMVDSENVEVTLENILNDIPVKGYSFVRVTIENGKLIFKHINLPVTDYETTT